MSPAAYRLPLVPGVPGATPTALRCDWYRRQAEIHGHYIRVLLTDRDVYRAELQAKGCAPAALDDLIITWTRHAATLAHLSGAIEAPR